jgi:hypothetical protein
MQHPLFTQIETLFSEKSQGQIAYEAIRKSLKLGHQKPLANWFRFPEPSEAYKKSPEPTSVSQS